MKEEMKEEVKEAVKQIEEAFAKPQPINIKQEPKFNPFIQGPNERIIELERKDNETETEIEYELNMENKEE